MKVPIGETQLTGLTVAKGLGQGSGGAIPAKALWAEITVDTADVNFRDDGTAPTATVGILLRATALAPFVYSGPLSKIQFIQRAAGAVINVNYYGVRSKQ
jgi:hypothetical protein